MALSGGRVAASLYALHIGTSEAVVGVLFGLYGILPMFLSLAVGRWTDRVGPLVPIRAGIVAVAAGTALAIFVPHIAALLIMSALCGIGFNLVTVAGQYAVGQLSDGSAANRVKHFGWFSLGQATANVVGPIVVGVMIDYVSHKAAFIVMAASAGCALLCVLLQAPKLRALHKQSAGKGAARNNVWSIVSTPSMQRIYIVGILLSISWDIFLFLMPILGHRQQLSASIIGIILAAFSGGTFSVRLMMPWFSRRFTEWQILRASIIVIVAVYVVLPLTHVVPLLMLIGYLFGMAVGCSQPNMLSLLHAKAPPGRGAEAVGLRQMLCNASGVIVPLMFGATSASLGILPIFWGVAALMATAFPMAYRESKA